MTDLDMLLTKCTVWDGHGGRCRKLDLCTLVRTVSVVDGRVLHEHRVCAAHRQQMGLPPHAVGLTSAGQVRIVDDGTIPPMEDV